MSEKPVVGFVGVGLMGWGMAKNAVEKGWPLRVVAHRKREAVEDLVGRGAREVASLAEMAAEAEVVVLCVTGSPRSRRPARRSRRRRGRGSPSSTARPRIRNRPSGWQRSWRRRGSR